MVTTYDPRDRVWFGTNTPTHGMPALFTTSTELCPPEWRERTEPIDVSDLPVGAEPAPVRRRKPRGRHRAEPVITTNVLDGLPAALRRTAEAVGDMRRVKRTGAASVEMDIESARSIGLLP
jgi:hypothetical protein